MHYERTDFLREQTDDRHIALIQNILFDHKLSLEEKGDRFIVTQQDGEVLLDIDRDSRHPYRELWRALARIQWVGESRTSLRGMGIPPSGRI